MTARMSPREPLPRDYRLIHHLSIVKRLVSPTVVKFNLKRPIASKDTIGLD